MTKQRILSLISLLCYAAFIAVGLILGVNIFSDLGELGEAEGTDQLGGAIAPVLLLVVGALSTAYGTLASIPFFLKLFDLIFERRLLSIFCIFFDVIYLAANALLLLSSAEHLLPFILLGVASLLSLICNIIRTGS